VTGAQVATGLALALLLAGCEELRFGGQVIQTDALSKDGHRVQVTIDDPQSLIETFSDSEPDELLQRVRTIDVARVPGDASALDVAWLLRPCNRSPVMKVGRTSTGLAIGIDPGPSTGDDCDAIGIPYRLRLGFDRSIEGWAIQRFVMRDGVAVPQ
jgi:hypothetical protein